MLDPVVHRVEDDEVGIVDLIEHLLLHGRVEVAEADDPAVAVRRGQDGVEPGEHVEVRRERVPAVEVVVVAAGPEERLAVLVADEPLGVDPARAEEVHVLLRKVPPDDADDADGRGEVARREGDVRAGATENAVGFAERGLDGVEGDGADGEDAHSFRVGERRSETGSPEDRAHTRGRRLHSHRPR